MGLKSWIIWKGGNLGYGFLSRFLWPRASSVAIIVEEKKILAIDTGNYLMLPGGGLEYGESFEEAAKRETLEETGYRVKVKEKISEKINSVGGVEQIYQAELLEREQVHDGDWEGEPIWLDLEKVGDRDWRYNRSIKDVLDSKQS